MYKLKFKKILFTSGILLLMVIGIIIIIGIKFPEKAAVFTGSKKVVAERVLIPGGQSVGIEMSVKGALIVGVENNSGPLIGDMIIGVNGTKITSPDQVNEIVAGKKDKVELTVIRNQRKIKYNITPYYDKISKEYKLGFWIKDKIAGIGTLSFYDPATNKFALLGHGIYEAETKTLLVAKDGYLLNTKVDKITEGKAGTPGEIGGVIYNFENPIGTIEKNTEYGLYGTADNKQLINLSQPLIMARQDEIEKGEAYIMTTINNTKVERFKIKISKINKQKYADTKGIEFQVTDKKLLDECGGIIQGMSGSPIIQNNRIIGAVTHVFVNNPKKGYGIFVEWMVDEVENNNK